MILATASAGLGPKLMNIGQTARRSSAIYSSGQHFNPVRVIAFNTAEGWSLDVSEEIANELADLIAIDERDVPSWIEDFIQEHVGSRPIQLSLLLRGMANRII